MKKKTLQCKTQWLASVQICFINWKPKKNRAKKNWMVLILLPYPEQTGRSKLISKDEQCNKQHGITRKKKLRVVAHE